MYKVSKLLYQSSQYDNIIYKWHNCLRGGQKWNKKIITLPCIKSSLLDRFCCLRCLKTILVAKAKLRHTDCVHNWCQRGS